MSMSVNESLGAGVVFLLTLISPAELNEPQWPAQYLSSIPVDNRNKGI